MTVFFASFTVMLTWNSYSVQSKAYRYRAAGSFPLSEMDPLRMHAAHLPFSLNTLPPPKPQAG